MSITVLIADDHTIVRAGIRALVESLDGIAVVGEAGDGREAVELASRLHPDVVLMDITMPGVNGLEAAASLTREHPRMRLIVLSMHSGEAYVMQALKAGAAGYLLKDSAVPELPLAIQAVMRGEKFISPAAAKHVVGGYLAGLGASRSPLENLTARQRQILRLIAEGHSTKAIAHVLGLSAKTVETHRRQLMERLQIFDVPGLVRFAIRVGLVTSEM